MTCLTLGRRSLKWIVIGLASLLLLGSFTGLFPISHASYYTSRRCAVRIAIYAARRGFRLRSIDTERLAEKQVCLYRVPAISGRSYLVIACGDSPNQDLDIYVYSPQRQLLTKDTKTDHKPMVGYTADSSQSHYIAVRMYSGQGWFTMGLLYRASGTSI